MRYEDTDEGKALLGRLDAYGHMTWTVSFGEEGDERGDLLACADFEVGTVGGDLVVAYHVVTNSESGGFIQTSESGVVPIKKAPFGLLHSWSDVILEQSHGEINEDEAKQNFDAAKAFDDSLAEEIRLNQTIRGNR